MSNLEPDLDREARERFGKPLVECGRDELRQLAAEHLAVVTRIEADVDRADAALREARCGCSIRVPLLPDGSPDIGRGRVQHTEQCINHTDKETDR